ncbi:MAG: hypothetical protein KGK16_09070, partial [Bradyrhizobium sp.]|nr:hypothetical protein [Bradyrhizobium sp.]
TNWNRIENVVLFFNSLLERFRAKHAHGLNPWVDTGSRKENPCGGCVRRDPGSRRDGFPFGFLMTLETAPQPGSKRLPSLEIGDSDEASRQKNPPSFLRVDAVLILRS